MSWGGGGVKVNAYKVVRMQRGEKMEHKRRFWMEGIWRVL